MAVPDVRALTILYHDVVERDFDESGFPGAAAARYKFKRREFEQHLSAMKARTIAPAVAASLQALSQGGRPFVFTVDDGGASALYIATQLEQLGWRGVFFVTTDLIGKPAFLSPESICDLSRRGHTIGSHSCSHPYRMAQLPDARLDDEWQRSVTVLSQITGKPIETASVPGGYYSTRVADAAARSGIRVLFNSEPTTRIHRQRDCLIVGRYNVYGGTTAAAAADLAAGAPIALFKQQVAWAAKKAIKTVAAPIWDQARHRIFKS